ncbi:prepilin peptidase [Caldanaerobacter subterraneus]|uniref:Prepilin peptidase n=1 Tax=Caldanaerobacter subterraneus TaxID=911092 RepID=A0A7Y2L689_9THEO|nr:prepilin peptidase [Caldanaerobacter subterraneus]NNG66410.1 prepilin peptidase [Caldanaerobacter subterraneus]
MVFKRYFKFSLYILLFLIFDIFVAFLNPFIGIYLFIFFAGAFTGSFWLVLIDRIPKNRSILAPNTCDACGYIIPEEWTLPIIPYILQKGKCLNCGSRISLKYPMTEIFSGILFCAITYFSSLFYLLYFVVILSFILLIVSLYKKVKN